MGLDSVEQTFSFVAFFSWVCFHTGITLMIEDLPVTRYPYRSISAKTPSGDRSKFDQGTYLCHDAPTKLHHKTWLRHTLTQLRHTLIWPFKTQNLAVPHFNLASPYTKKLRDLTMSNFYISEKYQ
jgi:hypothetical protein